MSFFQPVSQNIYENPDAMSNGFFTSNIDFSYPNNNEFYNNCDNYYNSWSPRCLNSQPAPGYNNLQKQRSRPASVALMDENCTPPASYVHYGRFLGSKGQSPKMFTWDEVRQMLNADRINADSYNPYEAVFNSDPNASRNHCEILDYDKKSIPIDNCNIRNQNGYYDLNYFPKSDRVEKFTPCEEEPKTPVQSPLLEVRGKLRENIHEFRAESNMATNPSNDTTPTAGRKLNNSLTSRNFSPLNRSTSIQSDDDSTRLTKRHREKTWKESENL